MANIKNKCIIILSYKSSGSSSLQNFLTSFPQANHVLKTRHYENETLYWTKAASVLDLNQTRMENSEVPIPKRRARSDIIDLITDNVGCNNVPDTDQELIYEGWRLLCNRFAPVFVEKSPHHLCQWSALELIAECISRLEEIDFLIIGLIRNPMDTLYSGWRRWKISPEKSQQEWLLAYTNLLNFLDIMQKKCQIVRYEDFVNDPNCLKPILDFMGASGEINEKFFHSKSLSKWKKDPLFGFNVNDEVKYLAEKFGYSCEELRNKPIKIWPLYRIFSGYIYNIFIPFKKLLIKIRDLILVWRFR